MVRKIVIAVGIAAQPLAAEGKMWFSLNWVARVSLGERATLLIDDAHELAVVRGFCSEAEIFLKLSSRFVFEGASCLFGRRSGINADLG